MMRRLPTMRLRFAEPATLSVETLAFMMMDIAFAHDLAVMTTLPEYKGQKFTGRFFMRDGRRTAPSHKLYVKALRHESPLEAIFLLPAMLATPAALLALVATFEKVRDWSFNREKVRLEVAKLRHEVERLRSDGEKRPELPMVERLRLPSGERQVFGLPVATTEAQPADAEPETLIRQELEGQIVERLSGFALDLTDVEVTQTDFDLKAEPPRRRKARRKGAEG